MNRLFKSFDKLRITCSAAFLITALLCLFVSLISELQFGIFVKVNEFLKNNYIFFINLIFVYVITSNKLDSRVIDKKNINISSYYVTIIFIASDIYYYINSGEHFSVVYSILFALLFNYIFLNFKFTLAFILSILTGFVTTALLVYTVPFILIYVQHLAEFLKNKPSLFSAINNVYTLLFSDRLGEYIYSTGIGLTKVVDGEIITGVKSYFIYDILNKDISIAKFLSSNYIISIFASFGILLNLYSKVDIKSKLSFIIVIVTTIVGGNNLLLSLFLMLLNPISYFAYLIIIFLTNAVVSMIDIRIGYLNYPNLIELIKFIDKPFWFMIVGIIIVALTYFMFEIVSKNINEKRGFFLDKNSKRVISALGGLKNIDRFEDGILYVKNPNLINILKIDCEIYNNEVILLENDIIVLKEYL